MVSTARNVLIEAADRLRRKRALFLTGLEVCLSPRLAALTYGVD
jgi:hypothetical protein